MSIKTFYESSRTNPRRFWNAIGPFPRSVWIHPHTPEDSLDRACRRVLKRFALANNGVWPHLPENAHVFAEEDGGILSYRGHDDGLSIQCSHGHEPDKTKEIKNREEADRRKTEDFPGQILLPKKPSLKANIPEGPLDKDFPPLPPPTSRRGDRPPQQAPVSISGPYKATVLKEKPNIQLHGGKPWKAQKQNQKEHPKVKPLAKTAPEIGTQTNQDFTARPSSPQTGNVCKEEFILEGQSLLPGCSHLPEFASFQMAEELVKPKDHKLKGGDVELGRSADGVHMAQTRAGSRTRSVQDAAGPLDNAKCHIYRKDATVAKTKATDISVPEDMDGIQTWNSRGRCPLQNVTFFTGTGHSLWSLPANCFLWFSEVESMYMVVNPLLFSNLLPPPELGFSPYYIVGDASLWPYQHGDRVNFPDNVNPSAAGRQCFVYPANSKVDLLCSLRQKL